uniref:HERV-H LTR-associating 2b, tandem duplicate 1 n=1 Tax=Hucho hucho TaxID=62062 RepID=A0A4W5MWL0_9TELE
GFQDHRFNPSVLTGVCNLFTDAHVTCVFLEDCVLPCIFQPDSDEVIRWLKQEVPVHSFQRGGEWSEHEQYAGRTSLFTHLVSRGNASLHLRGCGPRDRGRYKCHVRNSAGVYVNLRLQLCVCIYIIWCVAPIRALSLELSRLSGYEELKCTTQHVYPAPHVAWATDPPTTQPLRPITRKLADRQGLYAVESRLRRLNSRSELTYICTVNSSYGSQTWTASLRERGITHSHTLFCISLKAFCNLSLSLSEINGVEGKDLTIPCHAPPYQPKSSLYWKDKVPASQGLTVHSYYYSRDQLKQQNQPYRGRTALFNDQIPKGNASLLLRGLTLQDQGRYKCYTSTINGNKESFINITVEGTEHLSVYDDHFMAAPCVMSTLLQLQSHGTIQNSTSIKVDDGGLYDITSTKQFSRNQTNICTVTSGTVERRATLRQQGNQLINV